MTTKKSFLLVALVIVLLTFSVGGTIAWLVTSTGPITNTFAPSTVDTQVLEEFNGTSKSSITVYNKNYATNIPVYVRVRLVANWVNANGEIVAPATITVSYNTTNWTQSGDYYYYNEVLPVDDTTENLLSSPIVQPTVPDGVPADSKLQVVVLHQSIQADGMGATGAQAAWNVVN